MRRLSAALIILISPAQAQKVISLEPQPTFTTSPSVDNGIADGISKPAGSPSVGDGRANGLVKPPGAPSVGDGIVKSTTVNP